MKEPYLATVIGHLVGRDVVDKLYIMNDRVGDPFSFLPSSVHSEELRFRLRLSLSVSSQMAIQ